ncbi:MAG TPA: hypothetical protein VF590_19325, partial [Isosphaeraceae bacterium]
MTRSMGNGRVAVVAASALGLALATATTAWAQGSGRSPEGGSTGGSGHIRTAGPGAPPGGTNTGGGSGGNANFGQGGFNPLLVNPATLGGGLGGNANFGQAGFNPAQFQANAAAGAMAPGAGGIGPGGVAGTNDPRAIGGFQPGYNVFGANGGFGFGPGGGGASPFGLSPYDEAVLRNQSYALNASRYDLNTAQALQAYQAANFYNTLANTAAAANYKQGTGMMPYFNV